LRKPSPISASRSLSLLLLPAAEPNLVATTTSHPRPSSVLRSPLARALPHAWRLSTCISPLRRSPAFRASSAHHASQCLQRARTSVCKCRRRFAPARPLARAAALSSTPIRQTRRQHPLFSSVFV
jgi:hypothetical protein